MTDNDARDDALLETAFAPARADPPLPAADLAARVLGLALAEQPRRAGGMPALPEARSDSVWRDIAALLGGWRGAGGLTMVMLAGFAVGLGGVVDLPVYSGADAPLELMPGSDGSFAAAGEEE